VKDKGTVIATEGPLALVKVSCTQACRECPASSLCKSAAPEEGTLSVRNPVNAHPGDEVVIEVPESRYNRVLIGMFAGLLGFFLGLALAVPGLILYFRKNNDRRLYPSIVDITQKGERHG